MRIVITLLFPLQFELRELKRRQEQAEAEERAKREQEERNRQAALAEQAAAQMEAGADRPDTASPSAEDRPGKNLNSFFETKIGGVLPRGRNLYNVDWLHNFKD